MWTYLLLLLSVAVLLDGFAEAAVLQVLDPDPHHVQQPLQLCGPLRLLCGPPHVLLNPLSTHIHKIHSNNQTSALLHTKKMLQVH